MRSHKIKRKIVSLICSVFVKYEQCGGCWGSGKSGFWKTRRCPNCKGKGFISTKKLKEQGGTLKYIGDS